GDPAVARRWDDRPGDRGSADDLDADGRDARQQHPAEARLPEPGRGGAALSGAPLTRIEERSATSAPLLPPAIFVKSGQERPAVRAAAICTRSRRGRAESIDRPVPSVRVTRRRSPASASSSIWSRPTSRVVWPRRINRWL